MPCQVREGVQGRAVLPRTRNEQKRAAPTGDKLHHRYAQLSSMVFRRPVFAGMWHRPNRPRVKGQDISKWSRFLCLWRALLFEMDFQRLCEVLHIVSRMLYSVGSGMLVIPLCACVSLVIPLCGCVSKSVGSSVCLSFSIGAIIRTK